MSLQKLGQSHQAEQVLRNFLDEKPKDGATSLELARSFIEYEQWNDAVRYFHRSSDEIQAKRTRITRAGMGSGNEVEERSRVLYYSRGASSSTRRPKTR